MPHWKLEDAHEMESSEMGEMGILDMTAMQPFSCYVEISRPAIFCKRDYRCCV